ncbi:YbfB/YjiJ family MFS transporter [Ochrobactrum quorumnocens]|jgi:MFS family permease|uniref:YbfB/YjiJ family MFS transporter n=1 Tax=Ochrobactrum quorumnocens TaxID=271865 RepID=UPI00177FAEB3|nr:YbfB/YjiJ family MFS transporter [Brucella sp. HL-2]MBD7991436.1 YbfB/YjiJ family MFS transporter [Ochrobactrum gallinarum]MCV9909063.1 YbfB/YjiJ family MFS transporter [Brucella sp. HL-2]
MRNRPERGAAIAAALVLIIGMGFGRFAFTGLYPLMVADGQISIEGGSYAAAANYAGYLIGALLAVLLSGVSSRKLCTIATVTTVIAIALLALPMPEWLIITIRGFAGLFSAISMIAASHWLIHDQRLHDSAPVLYSGVGIGIVVSAEIIALSHLATLPSHAIWFILAVAALILTVTAIAMQWILEQPSAHQNAAASAAAQKQSDSFGPTLLVAVYGLAGFGYIITATYLPLLVRSTFDAIDPVHIWAIFGLGAVPSCFLWHFLRTLWGSRRSLMVNLAVQAIGVALPLLHVPAAYIVSALLVGGTFMGTVTIAMPAARHLSAKTRVNMLAIMTASYGAGQIIGPLMANALYVRTSSFDGSLMVAATALIVGAVLCLTPKSWSLNEDTTG